MDLGTTAHNLRLRAELTRILSVLARAEIPCVVLKGFPLLEELGEGLHTRRLADNDILVRAADAERAYESLVLDGMASLPERDFFRERALTHEHSLIRREADGGFLVCELHWCVFPPALCRVSESLVWQHT